MEIKKAVITAAGWGTRFLPATKAQPKEMLPLLNKPVIQYCVEEAAACGVGLIAIVTSSGKRAIEDYFDRHFELEHMLQQKGETGLLEEVRRSSRMVDICYIRQKEQLGLGHAVLTSRNIIGSEPFFLLLPDDIFEQGALVLRQMKHVFEKYSGAVLAVKRVPKDEVSRYGIINYEQVDERIYRVTDLVEKPRTEDAPSNLAIMGRYLLTPGIFGTLLETTPGKNGEIQLTDALKESSKRHPVYAYEFEGERWDTGTMGGWLETTVALALRNPELAPGFMDYLRKVVRQREVPAVVSHII